MLGLDDIMEPREYISGTRKPISNSILNSGNNCMDCWEFITSGTQILLFIAHWTMH